MRSGPRALRPRPAPADSSDVVARLLAGDELLFESLVDRWRPSLLRVAGAITGNAASAEDVVQETWASVLTSLVTFKGRSSLRTWVHRICAHLALARLRQDERTPLLPDSTVDPVRFDEDGAWRDPPVRWTEETPEALAAGREVIAHIERAVEMLSPRQRAVITLRDVQGFSSREACELLGVTEIHLRVLLHRARSHVRGHCEKFYREAA